MPETVMIEMSSLPLVRRQNPVVNLKNRTVVGTVSAVTGLCLINRNFDWLIVNR